MIRHPEDMQNTAHRFRVLLAGFPGIGKSTLALSAPDPLHVDIDHGIDRIEPRYRKDYIQPDTYEEILEDLTPENVKPYKTIVVDTGGKLISLMTPWAIKQNPKNGKRDGSLSLQGYGFVGREFVKLMDKIYYELQKNVVVVFHAIEEKDGENTKLRIKVEGQTKNNVWEPMDLGGFVEIIGNDRTIGFSNCERYFAKGTRGVHGIYKIPDLGPDSPNDFLSKLFAEYEARAEKDAQELEEQKAAYEAAIEAGDMMISCVTDAETANEALPEIKKIAHALTSKQEVNSKFKARVRELGLTWSVEQRCYINRPATAQKPVQPVATAPVAAPGAPRQEAMDQQAINAMFYGR